MEKRIAVFNKLGEVLKELDPVAYCEFMSEVEIAAFGKVSDSFEDESAKIYKKIAADADLCEEILQTYMDFIFAIALYS